MVRADRSARVWRAVLSGRAVHTHVRLLSRLAGAFLALLLFVAVGTSVLAWSRTAALRNVAYPALNDVRQLDALLLSTREALRLDQIGGLARADSLADQFHRVADVAQRRFPLRDAALAADGEFRAYYGQARRSRPRGDRHLDAPGDALSDINFRALRGQLDAAEAAQRREIDAAYASLRQLQVTSGIAMALTVLAAIVLLASLARQLSQGAAEPMEDAARRAQLLADGDLDVELRIDDLGAEGALHRALARIGRTLRANQTAAEELAAGEYRIGTHDVVPEDRTGRALARVSAYLDYLSIAAQRVAEGDLTVEVEARSQDDTLGHAYAMMVQRIVSIVRDADATAQLITATAAEMQRMAAELATGASAEASAGRGAVERLTSIGAELRSNATRTADLERRTSEGAATVHEGTVILQESHDALQRILHRAVVVDHIARDAGLIALNTGIEVGRAGPHGAGFIAVAEEMRALATQAADASREIEALTVRGADAATRSTAMLARLAPAMTQTITLVRELAATSGHQAAALAQARQEISAVGDARHRAAAAAETLAIAADALVGHAARLGMMLAQFNDGEQSGERDVRAAFRRPSLHRPATERRPGVRRLALV